MKRFLLYCLVAAFAIACYPPQTTQPDSHQNINQNVIIGGSPPPTCAGVNQVSTNVPPSIHVNVGVPVKVASGNGASCDAQASPAWSASTPCQVSSAATVDTILTGTSTGSCTVTGCLSGICNSTTVQVVP